MKCVSSAFGYLSYDTLVHNGMKTFEQSNRTLFYDNFLVKAG